MICYLDYDLKVLGRNLKICREYYGYSVESIREYLQLGSVQSIYQYEKGVSAPRADTLLALMELYQLNPKDLRNADYTGPQAEN